LTQSGPAAVGLCLRCAHHRLVGNRHGARFHLCRRSVNDAAFPRYPTTPVRECAGFQEGPEDPWLEYAALEEKE